MMPTSSMVQPNEIMDAIAFRSLMRMPASSVVIVATGEGAQRSGCTVTAICSLSDDPPSVLVCLNRRSTALAAILKQGRFSANWLSNTQAGIADIFAGRAGIWGAERFGAEWLCGTNGVPLLVGAIARLECRLVAQHSFGSHDILLGEALGGATAESQPLLYAAGAYHGLSKQI